MDSCNTSYSRTLGGVEETDTLAWKYFVDLTIALGLVLVDQCSF